MTKQKKVLALCCLVIVAFVGGYALSQSSVGNSLGTIVGNCHNQYSFITPHIDCSANLTDETAVLEKRTHDVVRNAIATSDISRISVFYRDLENLQWFGINENDNFAPGNILKIPIAMAYFKLAETNPLILQKKYVYTATSSPTSLSVIQVIKPEDVLQNGSSYSAQELISRMIRYSDNSTVPILAEGLDASFLQKTYVDLGIYIPTSGGIDQNFVSVKTIAGMLRMLYNASYLDAPYSNQLLSLMSQSAFQSGIAAGVPDAITVANKFGEREDAVDQSGNGNNIELHDCGIIYAPKSPYVLCIMTQGKNLDDLTAIIASISKTVYENR